MYSRDPGSLQKFHVTQTCAIEAIVTGGDHGYNGYYLNSSRTNKRTVMVAGLFIHTVCRNMYENILHFCQPIITTRNELPTKLCHAF